MVEADPSTATLHVHDHAVTERVIHDRLATRTAQHTARQVEFAHGVTRFESTSSEQDDRAAAEILAGDEAIECHRARDREIVAQSVAGGPHERAVVSSVGEQEDQVVGATITAFEREATLQGLHITDPGLGLDRDEDARHPDHGIPGAQVRELREGHLCLPADGRWQVRPKTCQEGQMSRVTDRFASRECAEVQCQTHGRSDARDHVQGHSLGDPTLDPAHGRRRDTSGTRGRLLAQVMLEPCLANVSADVRQAALGLVECSVRAPFCR